MTGEENRTEVCLMPKSANVDSCQLNNGELIVSKSVANLSNVTTLRRARDPGNYGRGCRRSTVTDC